MGIIERFLRGLFGVGILVCLFNEMAWALRDIQSFSADFRQKVRSSEGGNALEYQGNIQALAPNKVLWKYHKPIPKDIYVNAGEMIIVEPKLQQAIFTRLQEKMDLLSLLKVAKQVEENLYEAVVLNQKYLLHLENGILKAVHFDDDLGNQVEIVFSNIVVNQKIDAEIFVFHPSSDMDIIYY